MQVISARARYHKWVVKHTCNTWRGEAIIGSCDSLPVMPQAPQDNELCWLILASGGVCGVKEGQGGGIVSRWWGARSGT